MGFFKRKQNMNCGKCHLNKWAENPCIPVSGGGEKGILFIASTPSSTEDDIGSFGHGMEYESLKSKLEQFDIDLDRDCYYMAAISCFPMDDRKIPVDPDDKYMEYCRANVTSHIEKLKPKVVIPMGTLPLKSLYGHRHDFVNGITQWRGHCVPDQKLKCWVAPIYDYDWISDHQSDQQAQLVYDNDIEQAVAHVDVEFKKLPSYKDKIKLLMEYNDIIELLDQLIAIQPEAIAFDYESNARRPYAEGTKLLTMSMYIPELDTAYAFPLQWRKHFTRREIRMIYRKLRMIMTNKETRFIAHNLSMEDSWTSEKMEFYINNWYWDTMIMQHLIETTPKSKGLKMQCFLRWGVEGYDDYSKKYITDSDDETDGESFNKLEDAKLPLVLEYNAYDSLFTWHLFQEQVEEFAFDKEGNEQRKFVTELYNDSAVAMTRTSQMGMKINVEYFEMQRVLLTAERDELEKKFIKSAEVKQFEKQTGEVFKITSAHHLRILFFDIMGYEAKKKTKKGSDSADHEALTNIDHPHAKAILQIRKIDKIIGTYIGQFQRLCVDNFLHPDFLLHVARTGRSCIAKGQLIDVVRDVSKYPDGIPIEDVRPGDLVYCYDDNLKLAIKKVLWAGKTGTKKVCEVHWQCHGGKTTGVLKATPEHRIRMVNGEYVPINRIDMNGDYRHRKNKSKAPKKRVLSLLRNKARLYATGKRIPDLEHRFIYETLFGNIGDDVIHHINGNHYDNRVKNLQRMTLREHSSHHNQTCNMSNEQIEKRMAAIKKAQQADKVWATGDAHYMFLSYEKFEFLKMMFKSGCRPTKMGHDFQTMKDKAESFGINIPWLRNRFNADRKYITRGMLKRNVHLGLSQAAKAIGVSYYKAEEQYQRIGVTFQKQNRGVRANNHLIKEIVYTGEVCDVYDIEVEDCHNFIASGLCVHNSSVSPNLQNISKRDAMAKKVVRSGIIAPVGYHFGEIDYDTLEVKIFATYCKDPALINYLLDSHSDMHRDQAMKIFMFDHEWQITKTIRFEAKNGWVFALFYGSYWKSCARNIWEKIISQKDLILGKKNPTDPDIHLRQHLKKNGIKTQEDFAHHLKRCEDKLWAIFHVTREYQQNAFKSALEKGYVESYYGFRRGGYIERGQIINTPVQGQGCQCLLDSYRILWKQSRREQWKSYFAGQIHDSILPMLHPTEVIHVLDSLYKTMCVDMEAKNEWLIVPMGIEASIAKLGDSWYSLIDFKRENGVWVHAKSNEPIESVLELPTQRKFG